ncbi:triose-phosphate isomerase [bacterium]|nr:MAG: triose-phosphate isomerase [bacterium]
MRKLWIAGNWKMNMGGREGIELLKEMRNSLSGSKVDVGIAPPFTLIPHASEILADSGILLGAQNMFYEEKGAFTGEISPSFLLDFGVNFVIIGHSERRKIFGEDEELIKKKVKKALDVGLLCILCVGETLEERERGETKEVVKRQVLSALEGLPSLKGLTIAYEPVWAIGTGKVATPEQACEVHAFIRELIKEDIRILYGGSVKPENARGLLEKEEIDGALVGGASLKVSSFSEIVRIAEEV